MKLPDRLCGGLLPDRLDERGQGLPSGRVAHCAVMIIIREAMRLPGSGYHLTKRIGQIEIRYSQTFRNWTQLLPPHFAEALQQAVRVDRFGGYAAGCAGKWPVDVRVPSAKGKAKSRAAAEALVSGCPQQRLNELPCLALAFCSGHGR